MTTRFMGGVLAFCAAVGCGSSPQPRFYALSPRDGALRAPSAFVIEVREPSLPGYLDRRELVASADRARIRYSGVDRWAEPLARMLGRVLAADLRARLPHAEVFAESSGFSLRADELVELSIQRFDRSDDGRVSLFAQVFVDSAGGPTAGSMRTVTLTEVAPGGSSAMIESMNRLVGRLADTVAARAPEAARPVSIRGTGR